MTMRIDEEQGQGFLHARERRESKNSRVDDKPKSNRGIKKKIDKFLFFVCLFLSI